jgi:hypothetical protein
MKYCHSRAEKLSLVESLKVRGSWTERPSRWELLLSGQTDLSVTILWADSQLQSVGVSRILGSALSMIRPSLPGNADHVHLCGGSSAGAVIGGRCHSSPLPRLVTQRLALQSTQQVISCSHLRFQSDHVPSSSIYNVLQLPDYEPSRQLFRSMSHVNPYVSFFKTLLDHLCRFDRLSANAQGKSDAIAILSTF